MYCLRNALVGEFAISVGETLMLLPSTSRLRMGALELSWLLFFLLHIVCRSSLLDQMILKQLSKKGFEYTMKWYCCTLTNYYYYSSGLQDEFGCYSNIIWFEVVSPSLYRGLMKGLSELYKQLVFLTPCCLQLLFCEWIFFFPFLSNWFWICFLSILQTQPVEEFYRSRGKLLEFDLPGGIPESWPKLLHALNLDDYEDKQSAAA